jgi:diketogulonate reductase-like aldo/keto reductase
MTTVPSITLNNGVEMPALGFGVFQTPPEETTAAVLAALQVGYRHVDTAAAYANERGVGDALRQIHSIAPRSSWRPRSGSATTATTRPRKRQARQVVEQIDLLILHQALPSDFQKTLDAYRALETLLADGKVRAIGVSNFMVDHLDALREHATVVPTVNQIEVHPYFAQRDVEARNAEQQILTQAWSPIGGITFYRDGSHGSTLQDPVIGEIATAHGKTAAQVMLRWHLQQGRAVVPKSTRPARIAENIDVFDFELSDQQLAAIDALDTDQRGGPEPADITLESFGRPIPEA